MGFGDGVLEMSNDKIVINIMSDLSQKFNVQLKSDQIRNSCQKLKAHDLFWITAGSGLRINDKAKKFTFSLALKAKD